MNAPASPTQPIFPTFSLFPTCPALAPPPKIHPASVPPAPLAVAGAVSSRASAAKPAPEAPCRRPGPGSRAAEARRLAHRRDQTRARRPAQGDARPADHRQKSARPRARCPRAGRSQGDPGSRCPRGRGRGPDFRQPSQARHAGRRVAGAAGAAGHRAARRACRQCCGTRGGSGWRDRFAQRRAGFCTSSRPSWSRNSRPISGCGLFSSTRT